jgi:putative transposase
MLAAMPRQARIVVPGLPHHITQRGNNRQDVFFVDGDRVKYLEVLREQCAKHGVGVLGYCLMMNHVHIVAIPAREDSLNLAIGRTHFIYTQYINRLHGRSGHLWQGRFSSCPMDAAYAVRAVRYIERNPVRAKITRVPWTYRWSSAAAHTGAPDSADVLDLRRWAKLVGDMPWKQRLTDRDDPDTLAAIRLHTQTGRPLANDSFLSKLETKLGRRLRPLPVGRPRKQSKPKPRKAGAQ